MIKAVAFDVDFTLTSEIDGTIPESTKLAVKQLREKGIKVVIASGRIISSLVNKLNGEIEYDYLVGCCGAQVVDADMNPIYMDYLDKKLVDDLTMQAKKDKFSIYWKFLNNGYVYGDIEPFRWYESPNNGVTLAENPNPDEIPNGGGIIAPKSIIARVLNQYGKQIELVDGGLILLDINTKGVNKAVGLEKLSQAINIPLSEFAAFGDSDNDREMLQAVGLSIAMGNGADTIKKISKYTTDKVSENGVMNALKKFEIL